ncbi:Aste57867_19398 [Aphanomyces stellatus]|uniref:Aste57867_19398 protein n=1 Tax=Aphanomyces stellatus TaxID=120398 RepID=A0A485LGP7_9STRA|nr:hypothetical protein As57867_019334 [Aphanomyces stellatus]VFT96112.1 Aste57867_19398 [Aphanomyces stellatus]
MPQQQAILVTGGSGFLGSYCVKLLLERGYHVHTTVRNPNNEKKVAHLKALPGATERLTIFQAELLQEGAFDAAIDGCSVVLHTASPFFLQNQTPETLVEPAVQGTLNVLRSVSRAPHVRRVVLTSSTVSIYVHCGTKPESHVFNEDDWSNEDLMRKNNLWYAVSKTVAEREAWSFVEKLAAPHFDLVTMCPTWILGPMLQPELNQSSQKIFDYMTDVTKEIPLAVKTMVDVRDVALAHIVAFENPNASGRYMLVGAGPTEKEICEAIVAVSPTATVPTTVAPGADPVPLLYDCKKAEKELGIRFIPLTDMVAETCASLIQHGFVKQNTP